VSSKIGGLNGSSPTAPVGAGRAVQRPQDAEVGNAQTQSKSGAADVQITGTARQMANLESAVKSLPAVNDAKVAQISSAIANGTYTVDAHHIANQLIQMEESLKDLPQGSGADGDNAHAD
jgi:negative regulator of flagellin synthesis FlgM